VTRGLGNWKGNGLKELRNVENTRRAASITGRFSCSKTRNKKAKSRREARGKGKWNHDGRTRDRDSKGAQGRISKWTRQLLREKQGIF